LTGFPAGCIAHAVMSGCSLRYRTTSRTRAKWRRLLHARHVQASGCALSDFVRLVGLVGFTKPG
jgi:hypothetical protein